MSPNLQELRRKEMNVGDKSQRSAKDEAVHAVVTLE